MLLEWIVAHHIKLLLLVLVLYLIRKLLFVGTFTKLKADLTGKRVLITGASAGIGKATAIQLLKDGAEVIFACRDKEKTMKVFKEIDQIDKKYLERAHFLELNLSSFKSVINFVNSFKQKFEKFDILINNAATFPMDFELTEDNIESTFQSNHLSHMAMTTLLLDHFDKKEGRIINVSSFAHVQCDWSVDKIKEMKEDKAFKMIEKEYYTGVWMKHYHYANTKISGIFYINYLSEYLEKHYPHIKAASLSPGIVYTEIARFFWNHKVLGKFYTFMFPAYKYIAKTPIGGAQSSLHLCYINWSEFINGGYYDNCKLTPTSNLARNKEVRHAVLDFSLGLMRNHRGFENLQEILKIELKN